jgi:predicted molibdopterin-dependent oxidoreductase YjgC
VKRLDANRHPSIRLDVDGRPLEAFPGETVATALLAHRRRAFRRTRRGELRGPFCNMGVCFECLVTVDGVANVRACVTPVAEGMVVETGIQDGR